MKNISSMPKILYVDVNFGSSSTGSLVKSLVESIKLYSKETICLYGRGRLADPRLAVKIASSSEVFAHAALARITGFNGIYSGLATNYAIHKLNEFKPDVVHLHELHGYYIDIFRFVRYVARAGIPIVWTFHCEYMYTGKCGHAFDCVRFVDECGSCPQLKNYPKSLLLDKTADMLSMKKALFDEFSKDKLVIACPSPWGVDRVKKSFLNKFRIEIVPNGIDTKTFTVHGPVNPGCSASPGKSRDYVLTVGSDIWSETKGGEAIVVIARALPSIDFIIVGNNIRKPELPANVILLPFVSERSQLASLYRGSLCYFLSSKRETFSMPCAESLACGKPIVGFESGGPDTLFPKGYAEFYDCADLEGPIRIIQSLASHSKVFHDSFELSRFANDHFSLPAMAYAYNSIYETLL